MAEYNPPLVVHIIYALTTGGLENGLINIINRMPADRYRHAIVCITGADEFVQRITAKGVQVFQLHKRPGHDFGFYMRAWKLLRELRPDIIHSRNLAALETQLAGLGCGARRVHGEHGREINDLQGTNWKYLQFRKIMRGFIHSYITVSRDLDTWLTQVVGVRPKAVNQIYNGVDHDHFSPRTVKPVALLPPLWRAVDGMLVIGTVGRLTPVKDQQLLLRAVAQLGVEAPAVFEAVRVVMVGDGPLAASLHALVDELGLRDVVWLPGDCEDVAALLAAMDVFVLPSLAEGISNTVLEAMAVGLPVIVTSVGGNVELVEEGVNGRLVPVGDVGALVEALIQLLTDESARSRFGANARQRVCERFDWNRTVEAYMDVYDAVLWSGTSQFRNQSNSGKAG